MRKITVTEENFEEILEKLQKICNKHKMFEFYRVYSEDMVEEKEYRQNSIGVRDNCKKFKNKNGDWCFKRVKTFYATNTYIKVIKHPFRQKFEQTNDTLERDLYSEMKCLIHMSKGTCSALVISEGDKVQFLPFGGFAVWTDDDYTRFDEPLTIYKNVYFPDFFRGKIKDLEEENHMREEKENYWDEHFDRIDLIDLED